MNFDPSAYKIEIAALIAFSWLAVALMKWKIPTMVPEKFRPHAAACVAVVGAFGEALLNQEPMMQALVIGVYAGMGALGLQSYVIAPAKDLKKVAPTVVFVFVLMGCTGQQADKAFSEMTKQIGPADESLRAMYADEIGKCTGTDAQKLACEAEVDSRFEPAIRLMQSIRTFWCSAKPEDC